MKYKYIGEDNSFCLDLVAYGIKGTHGYYLFKGDIIDVPNSNKELIGAMDKSTNFVRVVEPTKVDKKVKKEDKK